METRANTLRQMQICRFCLDDNGPFTNIYEKDIRDGKQSTPLPLQIMACVAIEVFSNDGMPQQICNSCRSQTIGAYNFKTTCKKSDDALKLYLATGNLIKPTTSRRTAQYKSVSKKAAAKRSSSNEHVTITKKMKPEYGEVVVYDKPHMTEETSQEEMDMMQVQETEEIDGSQEGEGSQDENTEPDEDQGLEEDEAINPILMVPQIETDVFPCPECERSFPLKQLLDLHVKNHNRERCFECDECGRKFFTKYDLAKHYQTHSSSKPFMCVVCNKTFSRESLLHRHEKIHIDVPKYLCTQCDRTFLTREDLDVHSEKHKKNRPFNCRICKKAFVFKQGLERHELTHSDEKPHKCNYCEASFTSPIKLMRHITSHAGLRPYPCKLCGRTFLLSHHLTRHMRSHYANKSTSVEPVGQHKCDVCSMSFRRKDSLINHSAIHSMVNLKCVICNTAFLNAKQVKEHITTHLAGLPYPCDKCDYSFESQDQLEEHELKHAEMEYEEQIEQEVTQENKDAMEEQSDAEDDESVEDEDISEFTITNDMDNNTQVVRRSKKGKTKNYAQFLKDELGSDVEEDIIEEDTKEAMANLMEEMNQDSIKPIVRTESTKVYARKNYPDRSKGVQSNLDVQAEKSETSDTDIQIHLEDLSKIDVKKLPNKKFIDMKFGNKTVKVQKLVLTKAEFDAMARDGKIEMTGDNLVYKHQQQLLQARAPSKNITIENIIDQDRKIPAKPVIMKTYVRKPAVSTIPTPVSDHQIIQDGEIQTHEQIILSEETIIV